MLTVTIFFLFCYTLFPLPNSNSLEEIQFQSYICTLIKFFFFSPFVSLTVSGFVFLWLSSTLSMVFVNQ